MSRSPYTIVDEFEYRISEWCGSKYAVAVESGTAAIFLSLMYRKEQEWPLINHDVMIPAHTYPSVPCSIIHAGFKVKFNNGRWINNEYELSPLQIWDAALVFRKNMFKSLGGYHIQCLSFHIKKHLPIGRGGMILTNDETTYRWLRKARFDGREPVPLLEDNFTQLGWNMYMQPSDAARGIQLFEVMRQKHPDGMDDLKVEEQGYPDLSQFAIYKS